ncbi:glycosyltransferase [Isoptericola sp. NEAU-Y5]|uniref:D-inositol 3-phosphate glycosyltransferase n=1 Tax=Isoptericola luteus TaxID=2879484 RepID=A0ABS7ZDA1_9MICO|nr:glycosyltransferase [Isoptericola sp. NEAU-Y5]MCA5892903.1 glycosyltransferase [Isoptericola sp. NEAU-Y5]
MAPTVALAHDYATQRGGAERVALAMARAFPQAPMYTTLYDPAGTFPEFADVDLRTSRLDRWALLRRRHRLALPLLAAAVDAQAVEADVLLASSTGWAHGYRGARRTVVYCHAPARWLYQRDRYLSGAEARSATDRGRAWVARAALGLLGSPLRTWDRAAAERADVYLANSTVTRDAVRAVYGIEAEILPPPPAMLPAGQERAVAGLEPGFLLCVARLLPYKNVDVLVEAARRLGGPRLVVVGDGPDRARLTRLAQGAPVTFLGRVDDAELRWLYRSSALLVAASYEDFGLSPLEAGAFGRPSVVLGAGGYLDTVVDGRTGVHVPAPDPAAFAEALAVALGTRWDEGVLTEHVRSFAEESFARRLRAVVDEAATPGRGARTEEHEVSR